MPILGEKRKPQTGDAPLDPGSVQAQRRRMLIALALLLLALGVVLVKDRQFWLPSSPTAESEALEQGESETTTQGQAGSVEGGKPGSRSAKSKPAGVPAAHPSAQDSTSPPAIAATNRAVLPPLEVEVVAGNRRQTVPAGNASIRVDLQPKSHGGAAASGHPETAASSPAESTTNAAERVRLSPDATQVVSHPVEPTYPMLARQMKVQGSVLLRALIGKDGIIQDLRVLSGPAILSSAAQEAVKQWRFKPYYQHGEPVETQCSITVNFTISTQ